MLQREVCAHMWVREKGGKEEREGEGGGEVRVDDQYDDSEEKGKWGA